MKIHSLTLAAFRGFTGVTLDLGARRILIGGINGAGKTTCREAIRWVLSGKAQGLDARGTGVEILAPETGNAPLVQAGVVLEEIGSVIRSWTPQTGTALSVERLTGGPTDQQAGLYEKLKTTEAFLQAVLDSATFLKLDHADAKALVMALLDVRVSVDLQGKGVAETLTLDELETAYQEAFNERKVAKKTLAGFFVPPAPVVVQHHPIEAIDATLKVRRDELDALLLKSGGTIARRQALETEKQQKFYAPPTFVHAAYANRAAVQARIEEVEERLAVMEADAIGDDIDEAIQTLPVAVEPGVGTEGRLVFLRSRMEALANHHPKNGCVLDPDVPCETTKVRFTKAAKTVEGQIDALPKPVAAVASAPKPPNPLTETRSLLDFLKTVDARFAESEAKTAQWRVDYKAVLDALEGLPSVDSEVKDIAELRGRIQKGEGIRQAAVDYAAAQQAYAKKVTERKALQAEVDRLEALVETLGPKGVRVKALGTAIAAFEEAINGFLVAFNYKIWFVLDPAWAVMVNGRRVESYSKSEQYRIGIAVQLAIAKMSGLDFAIVDELDMLTAANRETIARMLHFSALGQIIVLGSREPEVGLPTIEGVICHRLQMVGKASTIVETTGVAVAAS